MTATARVRLPFPVSVNGMFPDRGKQRVPSPKYRAWRDEAGWMLKQQKPPKFEGQVQLRIDLRAPDKRLRDADNYAKACVDALVSHGVIRADHQFCVRRVSIGWEDEAEHPCTVMITAVERQMAS